MGKRYVCTCGSCAGFYMGDIVDEADLVDSGNIQRLLDLGAFAEYDEALIDKDVAEEQPAVVESPKPATNEVKLGTSEPIKKA